jgi:phenylalanyl-tRNA synthetase beta chain
MKVSINPTVHPDPELIRADVSQFFTNRGFIEIMNNSLTKSAYYDKLATYPADKLVHLLNPLSSDLDVMRQSLIPGGLEVVAYNIHRQCNDLKLYEIGNVYNYAAIGDEPCGANLKSYNEQQNLAIFISAPAVKSWRSERGAGNYFALKGYVELFVKRFGMSIYDFEYDAAPSDIFAEGIEVIFVHDFPVKTMVNPEHEVSRERVSVSEDILDNGPVGSSSHGMKIGAIFYLMDIHPCREVYI